LLLTGHRFHGTTSWRGAPEKPVCCNRPLTRAVIFSAMMTNAIASAASTGFDHRGGIVLHPLANYLTKVSDGAWRRLRRNVADLKLKSSLR
jgi:hypothetical protein